MIRISDVSNVISDKKILILFVFFLTSCQRFSNSTKVLSTFDLRPVVSFVSNSYLFEEPQKTGQDSFQLIFSTDQIVTTDLPIELDSSALSLETDLDFEPIVIPAGQSSVAVTFKLKDDKIYHAEKVLKIKVKPNHQYKVSNLETEAGVLNLTVKDPVPQVSFISSYSLNGNGTDQTLLIKVALDQKLTSAVVVPIQVTSTLNQADFLTASSVAIPAMEDSGQISFLLHKKNYVASDLKLVTLTLAPSVGSVSSDSVTGKTHIVVNILPTTSEGQSTAGTAVMNFAFTLPTSAVTSAGVYDSQDRLICTLWRGEPLVSGSYNRIWNGLDDAGSAVSDNNYKIKLIYHNVTYTWEGVVGNSSDVFGESAHKAFQLPASLVVVADDIIYASGYNEGQNILHQFKINNPKINSKPFALLDPFVSSSNIASDGARLYWASSPGFSQSNFVGAFDISTKQRFAFSAGQDRCLNYRGTSTQCYEDQDYRGVINFSLIGSERPTGLAVQKSGQILAVAHGQLDVIRLFNKVTGALLNSFSVDLNPNTDNQIAMTPDGDLWVLSGTSLKHFTNLATQPLLLNTFSGLEKPLAVSASPTNANIIWVADGGASQQLKKFDRNGQTSTRLGQLGGYASNPEVNINKFCFSNGLNSERTAIVVDRDESIWVVDNCNNRMFRVNSDQTRFTQISYIPHSYKATVDHGRPSRVFANFLEFEVSNEVSLGAGESSWRLVRNWLGGIPAELNNSDAVNTGFGGFNTVETLSNGKTYGMLSMSGKQVLVELPSNGPLKVIRNFPYQTDGQSSNVVLYENGNLGYSVTSSGTQKVMLLPLTGFDSENNPVWSSSPQIKASVPVRPNTPYHKLGTWSGALPPRFPITSTGKVIYFDQAVVGNEGFHLGAVALNSSDWLWQASPSGPINNRGNFQTKAIDGYINYGGNSVWNYERHVVYGFHGEFYRDMYNGRIGQANQQMHFYDNGLFIGQFGLPSTRVISGSGKAGCTGNSFSPTLVRAGSKLYMYLNDESAHGGVTRWRIDGWQSINEISGNGNFSSNIVLSP